MPRRQLKFIQRQPATNPLGGRLLTGREWLAGDFSLADIAAAPNVYRCEILGRMDLIDARPGLARWYRGLRARRSFIETYRFAPSVRRDSPRVN